jgi:hypothetical protein
MKALLLILWVFLMVIPMEAQTVERVSGFIAEDIGDFPFFFTPHDTNTYFVTLRY